MGRGGVFSWAVVKTPRILTFPWPCYFASTHHRRKLCTMYEYAVRLIAALNCTPGGRKRRKNSSLPHPGNSRLFPCHESGIHPAPWTAPVSKPRKDKDSRGLFPVRPIRVSSLAALITSALGSPHAYTTQHRAPCGGSQVGDATFDTATQGFTVTE